MFKVGLLTRFGVISAVACLSLGAWLGTGLQDLLESRARAASEREAETAATAVIGSGTQSPRLLPGRAFLEDRAGALVDRGSIAALSLWDSRGRLRFTTLPPGERPSPPTPGDGDAPPRLIRWGGKQTLEVLVPVATERGSVVAGIQMPYEPTARELRADTRGALVTLAVGMSLLYLMLMAMVAVAARRLRRQAEVSHHLALHDALTDLPNRTLFRDRAEQAIVAAQRGNNRIAILIMDLDRFKEINDTLGHHHGDLLLKQIGPRLRKVLRESDTIARLGGDEFGVLLPSVADSAAAVQVASKIEQALHAPFNVNGSTLHTGTSVGVAVYPEQGRDVDVLIQRADVAMYVAKSSGSGFELYTEERDQNSPGRLALMGELRKAVYYEDFVLLYQPKIDIRTGAIPSVEALARWRHPERGLVGPDEFIPMAENSGLIDSLTMQVLTQALRQCKDWERDGIELGVAVNLSVRNLLDAQLPERIDGLLRRFGLPAERLELEITESTLMSDPLRAMETLRKLDELGVRLAVDDFGTGYSSLLYLKRFPVSAIKIDKSFIMNMEQSEQDLVIVRSTIELGRSLGLQVVAEGVESEGAWDLLARLGCDLAQGYYRGKPVPGEDIPWLMGLMQMPWTEEIAAAVGSS